LEQENKVKKNITDANFSALSAESTKSTEKKQWKTLGSSAVDAHLQYGLTLIFSLSLSLPALPPRRCSALYVFLR